jgi:hypothetical protein
MWHRVDLVRTDVSQELIASIFREEKSVATCSSCSSLSDISILKRERERER